MICAGYTRPVTLAEATATLAADGIPVAGGTDLMVKARAREPYAARTLVDLSGVPELGGIECTRDGALSVGAAVTLSELVASELVHAQAPLLAEACAHVGGVQTRNRATLGGNVANACPAADGIVALVALGACVRVAGPGGSRELALTELFRPCPACLRHEGMRVRTCLFADPTAKKLTLAPGELVARLVVPRRPAGERHVFRKLTPNASVDLATMSVAGVAALGRDGMVESLSVSMGGLYAQPRTLDEVSEVLVGHAPSVALVGEAAARAAAELEERSPKLVDLAYKRRALPGLLGEALCELLGVAVGSQGDAVPHQDGRNDETGETL